MIALIAGMAGCGGSGGGGNGGDGGESYTLTIGGTAGGIVTVDNVIIPGKTIFTYDAGTMVSLNATPDAGYQFLNWTGDVATIANVNAAVTNITMDGSYNITANFEQVKFMVAGGGYQTVGVRADGAIVAAGYNEFGQCNVAGWPNITEAEAGYLHTVGLKWDGSVVALGCNCSPSSNTTPPSNPKQPPWGYCFIATAAYGTPMAEEIQILREFRDAYLVTNPLGQALVELYYSVSPPIAEFITEHPVLKPIVRAGLVPAVAMSAIAVNTTVAEKMVIVGLLVLVLVALAVWAKRRRGRGPEYS
jgi:hypothetical protein